MIKIIKVAGQSMAPALADGDYVITLSRKIWPAQRLTRGRVYIIEHPDLGRIIKRLSGETPTGRLSFTGDNPASNSDHILGGIEKARIKARAYLHIHKNGVRFI